LYITHLDNSSGIPHR